MPAEIYKYTFWMYLLKTRDKEAIMNCVCDLYWKDIRLDIVVVYVDGV